ncbi:MAG: hypothetical protein V1929_13570 [bacterium]
MAPAYRVLRLVAGWTLIVIGMIGFVIPILPQIPFIAAGALLLAPYIRIFRRVSAWVHKTYPKSRPYARPFRIFKKRRHPDDDDAPGNSP